MSTPLHLTEGGRYDCPLCSDRFASVGEKKRHIRETHSAPQKETR